MERIALHDALASLVTGVRACTAHQVAHLDVHRAFARARVPLPKAGARKKEPCQEPRANAHPTAARDEPRGSPSISRRSAHGFPVWRERATTDWPAVSRKNLQSVKRVQHVRLGAGLSPKHVPACTTHRTRSKARRCSPRSQPKAQSRAGATEASRRLRRDPLRRTAEHHPKQTWCCARI